MLLLKGEYCLCHNFLFKSTTKLFSTSRLVRKVFVHLQLRIGQSKRTDARGSSLSRSQLVHSGEYNSKYYFYFFQFLLYNGNQKIKQMEMLIIIDNKPEICLGVLCSS